MADKYISISRFDGGLNTQTAPELLPPNMTASAMNFKVQDSGSISTRDGYTQLTATYLRNSPMKALYRYYDHDSTNKYWIAVCATAVLSRLDAATDSYGLVETESLTASASLLKSEPWASGGYALELTATATPYAASVPYSTYIKAAVRTGTGLYYSIDGGAYSLAATSLTSVTWSGITATTHTIRFKPKVRAANSFRLEPQVLNGASNYNRSCAMPSGAVYVRFSFYDDIRTGEIECDRLCGFSLTGTYSTGTAYQRYLFVGSYYQDAAHGNDSVNYGVQTSLTEGSPIYTAAGEHVARSTGWHTVTFLLDGTSDSIKPTHFDDVALMDMGSDVMMVPSVSTLYYTVRAVARSSSTSLATYYDTLLRDGALVDDFAATTAWTRSGTSSHADEVVTTLYDSTPCAWVDTVEYSAYSTWTRAATLSATATLFSFTPGDGKLWFGSDYDRVRAWDGSSLTASATGWPAAGFLAVKQSRLFAAGKNTDRTLVEYTDVDDFDDWTNGGVIRVTATADGGHTTGMAVWNNDLFIMNHDCIRKLEVQGAETNWVNREITNNFGCVAPSSLAVAPNGIVFLSADGVRAYGTIPGVNDQDGAGILLLSRDITPTIQRINSSYLDKCCGAVFNGHYYLSVPLDTATYNSHTLVYRFADAEAPASWSIYDYGVDCMHVTRGDDDYGLYGGTHTGHIVRMEYGTSDNGTAISMRYQVPQIRAGSYSTILHVRRMHLMAASDNGGLLSIVFDNDDAAPSSTAVMLTAVTDSTPIRIPCNARGRSLGMTFTASDKDTPVTISEVTLVHTGARFR